MKAVLIGAYGHQGYLVSAARESTALTIVAVARSGPADDLTGLLAALEQARIKVRIYDDWRKMLDAERPGLASIAPMYCEHQKISVECLRRGIHVICEKPVALTFAELDELEAVYAKGSAEFVGMHAMRYQPNFYAGYTALKAGLIGRPILINSQKSYTFGNRRPEFYKDRNKYGGSLCWVAIHAIDWTYWMAGPLENIYAAQTTVGNRGYGSCESAGVIAFSFGGGGVGCINFDFLKAQKDVVAQDRCRIAGENGVIEIYENKAWIVTHESDRRELALAAPVNFARSFVEAINGQGECLLTAEDTFAVTRLALRARDSADRLH